MDERVIELVEGFSDQSLFLSLQQEGNQFVDLENPLVTVKNYHHIGRELQKCRDRYSSGEEEDLGSTHHLHLYLTSDQEHVEILGHEVSVNLHFGCQIRDGHSPLVPFKQPFDLVDFFLIQYAHSIFFERKCSKYTGLPIFWQG